MSLTRFEKELSGTLGSFWKKNAEKELAEIQEDLENGRITIDETGVARNRIGRVLMDDMLEKLSCVTDSVSIEATKAARREETAKTIARYRRDYTGPDEEEIAEMRAAFGEDETAVNILTGDTIKL